MIEFNKYKNNTTEAFTVIESSDTYPARLFAIKLSKQDPKFVDDGKDPKDQISFMFDVLDDNKNHVHVSTKPMSIAFSDKAGLPKLFEGVTELKTGDDMTKFFYDDKGLGATFKVMVSVKKVEDKIYNTVTSVIKRINDTIEPSTVTAWDLNVYGKACEQFDLAEGYNEPKDITVNQFD